MATVTCSKSGLQLSISHISMTLGHTAGICHPIFSLRHKHLISLYKQHCSGKLSPTDSYLTFLALLNYTDHIRWTVPVVLDPNKPATIQLIERNIAQLVEVTELTNTISLPSFKQPSFTISLDTCQLPTISNWIAAWKANIETFKQGRVFMRKQEKLAAVEKKLSYLILSGVPKEEYPHVVANWAAKAADFPKQESEEWIRIIRSCFSTAKMFNTPLDTLKQIKAYCEENIEAGSIHFHALMQNLKEGISRHHDYLGVDSGNLGYTLLAVDTTKQELELELIKSTATELPPVRTDYSSDIAFLKAKLAYAIARNSKPKATELPTISTPTGDI